MRTAETTLDLTLAGTTPSVARLAGMTRVVMSLWRVMRNRRAVGSLNDLTDEQLEDIGLFRADVAVALHSAPLDAADVYLANVARQRASAFYRLLRNDRDAV